MSRKPGEFARLFTFFVIFLQFLPNPEKPCNFSGQVCVCNDEDKDL